MPIHEAADGQLIMRRDDGTEVFRVTVPAGWIQCQDNPTLFHSPDEFAFFGFVLGSQHPITLQPPMTPAPVLNPVEFDILAALTLNLNIRPGLVFNQHQVETVQIGGIRFKQLWGSDGEVVTGAYYAHIENAGQTIIFDGFLYSFLSKESLEAHSAALETAVNSLVAG